MATGYEMGQQLEDTFLSGNWGAAHGVQERLPEFLSTREQGTFLEAGSTWAKKGMRQQGACKCCQGP